MVILIVANNPELSRIWSRHLERLGHEVFVVFSQAEAANYMRVHSVDVIVLSLDLEDGSAIAIADYASCITIHAVNNQGAAGGGNVCTDASTETSDCYSITGHGIA